MSLLLIRSVTLGLAGAIVAIASQASTPSVTGRLLFAVGCVTIGVLALTSKVAAFSREGELEAGETATPRARATGEWFVRFTDSYRSR